MKKLTDTAKKLNNFFKIAQTVCSALAIAAVACTGLILAVWLLGWNPEFIGTGYESLDLGIWELTLADSAARDKWLVLLQAGISLMLSAGFCVIAGQGIRCIRSILLPVTEGKPFTSAASENLKKLAVLAIVIGALSNVAGLVDVIFFNYVYDLPNLLISDKITHASVNYTIDIGFLLISAVLFLLSYIFRYGTELQQLSDETL